MPSLSKHKGKERYKLWFVDMDGNEDFLTMSLTWQQANELESEMWRRKTEEIISDFLLSDDRTPDNYAVAIEYIRYKLQDEMQS